MIEFKGVTKKFGQKAAVNKVNFVVNDGELFTILGPNGAGKTTTLKLLTGLLQPDEGEILIDGKFIGKEPEAFKSIIGYIPDEPFIYPELSGREFVYFVARIYKMDRAEIENNFKELLKVFKVEEWIDYPSAEYSHGMRQKVIFMQALIHNPRILVIDEPLVGLDPSSGRTIKETLRNFVKRGNIVVMSTHTLSLAEQISDKICLIDEGIVQGVERMQELLSEGFRSLEEAYFSFTGGPND